MNTDNMNKIHTIANDAAVAAITAQRDAGMDVSWTGERATAVTIASAVAALSASEMFPEFTEVNGKRLETKKLLNLVLSMAWLKKGQEMSWVTQTSTQQKKAIALKIYAKPEKEEKAKVEEEKMKSIEEQLAALE